MRRQNGFTLLEVVMVLILLGVLAAMAIPRFVDLSEEAHDKVARATFASFMVGVNTARMQWAVSGGTSGPATNASGWPTGTPGGGNMTKPRCRLVWGDVLISPPPVNTGTLGLGVDGWWNIGFFTLCIYVYQPDTTAPFHIISYNATNGEVVYFGP